MGGYGKTPLDVADSQCIQILRSAVGVCDGLLGTCKEWDSETGNFQVLLRTGVVQNLNPINLQPKVVFIYGLKGAVDLNGKEGVCQGWDAQTKRFQVRLR